MNTLFLAIMTSLATLGSCTQVEDTLGDTDYPSKGVQGATYYLDSESGDDSQDGMSPETAWKTLGRLEKVYLQAGNAILLRCGSSWDGQLAPRGSGTQSAPIRIGHYGEGSLPVINGCGEVDAAVKLSNQSYWIIEGIEVTNLAPERDIYRCGIHIENNGGGTVSGIVIRNNRVHDVTSSFDYSDVYHPHQFGGISVSTKSVTVAEEKFDDILIEGNEVERVGRTGIVVWDFVWGSNTQSSTNVIIRGNTVREVDSDGILTYGCNGSLIEYNLADGCGSWREEDGFNGAAAIWCTRGKECVIQFNEARNTKALEGNDDGVGFDVDLDSSDCIVQYNYSHDNEGGFMLLIDAHKEQGNGSRGSIVRYNISQNDRKRIFMIAGGVTPGMQIYNNTVYVGAGLDTKLIDHTWDAAGDLDAAWSFRNNLIYNLGSGEWVIPGNGGKFEGNLYYGNHPASEPAEADKLTCDPLLSDPGSGGEGLASLDGYRLLETSPVVNAGVQVPNNGGRDFWGNPVSRRGQASIGAHEPNGEVQEGGYLYDPLDDWSLGHEYSANLGLDGSNPTYFDEDTSRAVRQDKEDGVVIYRLEGWKSASVTAYLGMWYGATPNVLRLYASATGEEADYVPVAIRYAEAGDVVEGWQKFEFFVNEVLPDGMNFLKIVMSDSINEAWAVQLGEVEISDEPAEVVEPEDNTFVDPMDNLSNLVFSLGDNLISAWSSEEDIANFFNGDAGRIARQSSAEAVMAWQYQGLADFAITCYYCGDPGDDFSFLQVAGTAMADPSTLTTIPVNFTLQAVRGDWREYLVRPAGEVPAGWTYFAIRLPESPRVPAGWELQISEVKLSDAPIAAEPGLLTFTDNLDDMSRLAAKSDNLVTDWGNESNFNGDGARATRSSSEEGFLVYELSDIRDFAIEAFFSTFIDNSYLKVYAGSAADYSDRKEIPCTFTELPSTAEFAGYTVTPATSLDPGFEYLYLELQTVPVEGNGWTTQIGSVEITYGSR